MEAATISASKIIVHTTPEHDRVLGSVQKNELGWWGTLNDEFYISTTVGPCKTLRACTKRMEQIAKKTEYQKGNDPMDQSVHQNGDASPKVRTPPKVLAQARLAKLIGLAETTNGRLRGFAPELDDVLDGAANVLREAANMLRALPDNVRPKRSRGTSMKEGAAYEIKEKYREQYAKFTDDGDAALCIVIKSIDDAHVLVSFGDTKAAVRRSHLGKEIKE